MNLTKYQELTGITVDSEDTAKITAQIRRTRTILESLLGYSLEKNKAVENQYEELGKASVDCILQGVWTDIDNLTLTDPDEVIGSYRLFNYNRKDKYFEVDPFTRLNAVKLVFIKRGDEPNGITHRTFTNGTTRVHKTGVITKYIEHCKECRCLCICENCVQLAVDADWLNEECLPDDLLYIWADMVTFYSNEKVDVKSETLATHNYTKFDRKFPETLPESIKILTKYAGPNGTVVNDPTI